MNLHMKQGSDFGLYPLLKIETTNQKWITNATFADYFTVACRTDKGGMVVLVVERQEGVETKPIKTAYSSAAGTAYVTFENIFVPYENTLGPDDGGLQVILSNFNHERFVQCHQPGHY